MFCWFIVCWFKGDLWVFTFVTGWQHHLSQSLQSQKSYQVRSLHKKIPLKIQKNCIFLYEILCRFFCYTFFVTLYCTHSKWADATIKHTVLKCSPLKKKKNQIIRVPVQKFFCNFWRLLFSRKKIKYCCLSLLLTIGFVAE